MSLNLQSVLSACAYLNILPKEFLSIFVLIKNYYARIIVKKIRVIEMYINVPYILWSC